MQCGGQTRSVKSKISFFSKHSPWTPIFTYRSPCIPRGDSSFLIEYILQRNSVSFSMWRTPTLKVLYVGVLFWCSSILSVRYTDPRLLCVRNRWLRKYHFCRDKPSVSVTRSASHTWHLITNLMYECTFVLLHWLSLSLFFYKNQTWNSSFLKRKIVQKSLHSFL